MAAGSTAATTIFALSSAAGRAGVAVVRISGGLAKHILEVMTPSVLPDARMAVLRSIKHPGDGRMLDRGLVIWFPGPASFTGEDCAELHIHGGRAVVQAVLEAIGGIDGCRMAEPGEFARRAFEAGKIDLVEAEGLADLIDAETEAQRSQALAQAGGGLSELYEGWREDLIGACALVEAEIDFSDEADVADKVAAQADVVVGELKAAISSHLDDRHRGEILREGFRVVLAGPPNVGKSSLLNALAKRDAAIVSEEAGTTRDVIEVKLDLEGLAIIVSDTAGLRDAEGPVEQEGIRRSLANAREADLVVWMEAPDVASVGPDEMGVDPGNILRVVNKADMKPSGGEINRAGEAKAVLEENDAGSLELLEISAATGQGLAALTSRIVAIAKERVGAGEGPAITRVRHRVLLGECLGHLRAFGSAGGVREVELRAEDLRRAAVALGRITGRVDVEDVLDQVFGRFCIGK